jgi:hypothetical protein
MLLFQSLHNARATDVACCTKSTQSSESASIFAHLPLLCALCQADFHQQQSIGSSAEDQPADGPGLERGAGKAAESAACGGTLAAQLVAEDHARLQQRAH